MGFILTISLSTKTSAHPVQDERTLQAEKRQKELDLGKSPNEFRLAGIDGQSYTIDSWSSSNRVTFVSISDTSETCDRESESIFDLISQKKKSDELFVLIHSGLQANRTRWADRWNSKRKSQKENVPLILWDPLQIVSMRFDLKSPGEFFSVEPKSVKILARGRLDGISTSACKETPDRGVSFPEKLSEAEFRDHFALPFMRACVRCHIFSRAIDYFGSLKSVHGWQAMSLKTLELARMPGGYEPNSHGENEIGYTVEDVRRVFRYLQNAKPQDSKIEQFSKVYRDTYKAEFDGQLTAVTKDLGQPDLILQAPKSVKVRASGDLIYRYMNLSEPFKEEKMIRAIILESEMTVIHHAHLIVVPKQLTEKEIKALETGNASAAAAFLKIYGPKSYKTIKMTSNGAPLKGVRMDQPIAATFSRPFRFSLQGDDEGVRIPKGSSLAVIFHFESIGHETVERPKFQVFFSKPEQKRREMRQFTTTPLDLTIPAHEKVLVRSEVDIEKPIRLEKILVHMHYRGVSARVLTRSPGKKEETLIADLPYHLFKLQNFYRFKNVDLKPGAQLITELVYDNTERNIANPYPDRPVKIGRASLDDEMHFPRIFYSSN